MKELLKEIMSNDNKAIEALKQASIDIEQDEKEQLERNSQNDDFGTSY